MSKRERKRRLPNIDKISYEEEAEWWDTHDITDYLDDFEVVEARLAKNLSKPKSNKGFDKRE